MEDIKTKVFSIQGRNTHINIQLLIQENHLQTILYYLLKPFGFDWIVVKKIIECLNGISGKKFYSFSHELIKDRENLIISPLVSQHHEASIEIPFLENSSSIETTSFTLQKNHYKNTNYEITKSLAVACLDYDKTGPDLILRQWKEGDKFYPLGMKGAKKISDFLIDQKVPINKKKEIYVLLSESEIVWVVNYRIDERYKITKFTKNVIEILFTNNPILTNELYKK